MHSTSGKDSLELASASRENLRQSLQLSEERYRLLVDAVTDYAIFLLDPKGIVSSWNKGAHRISGYTSAEIIGEHVSRFYPPESVDLKWPEHELNVAKVDGRFEDEGWRLRKDGTRFWANVIIAALYDEQGELWGYYKITRDLTERRAYEEALRKSEERFRLLMEGAQDCAIFLLNPQGAITSWNSGAENITGYQAEEIVGCHFSRFYPAEQIEQKWPEYELQRAETEGSYTGEGWQVRKDGSRFWADVLITPLYEPEGDLYGFAKVTRDLTQKRRLEALELSEKRTNEFLAMLSDELRNPLTPIASALGTMESAPPDDPVQERCRQAIGRQVAQISSLLDDLLDISQITAGSIDLEQEPVDFREVIARAVDSCPLIKSRGHSFEQNIPPDPVMVEGDFVRLTQAVVNLLNNAAQYMADEGHIQLTLESVADTVRLQIRDRGEGIAPEQLEEVFGLFAQGRQSQSRTQPGLGAGLSVARRLLEMQGGRIYARSDGPETGSQFIVELPKLNGAGDAATPAPTPPEASPSTGVRVLVVEDLPDVAEGMKMVLELWGHEVEVAHDGMEALELAPAFKPEAVLLDIGLPVMTGYEVAEKLRKLPELQNTTLIALTGYGQQSDRERAYAAGFDHHLVKGGSLEDLKHLLQATRG